MRNWIVAASALAAAAACAPAAEARTICTAMADAATGKVMLEQGDCRTRVSPASTFKIAIALMGYDAGFLKDEHAPALPFREGYPAWRPEWKQTTDPARWIDQSVVWYSQQVTQALGEARFAAYVRRFGYGNGDVSGTPGKHDGLTYAWLGSSLQISPLEQLDFLGRMSTRRLPVSAHALEMTRRIAFIDKTGTDWAVYGKTGSIAGDTPDGKYDRAHEYGWFIGWATRGRRTVVFARLIQDEAVGEGPAGVRAKAGMMQDLLGMLGSLPRG